jgi:hypothetical protein
MVVKLIAALCTVIASGFGGITVGPFESEARYGLIPDGGFEAASLLEWRRMDCPVGSFSVSSNWSFNGQYSLEGVVTAVGVGELFAAVRPVTVASNTTYRLSCYFHTGKSFGVPRLRISSASGNAFVTLLRIEAKPNVAQWQFVEGMFSTFGGITNLNLWVEYEDVSEIGETFFVDDLAMTLESSFRLPSPLILNRPVWRSRFSRVFA